MFKLDLYRLAIAISIKRGVTAPPLTETSNSSYRITDVDENAVFFTVLNNSELVPEGVSVYEYMERLAEHGVKEFYKSSLKPGGFSLSDFLDK